MFCHIFGVALKICRKRDNDNTDINKIHINPDNKQKLLKEKKSSWKTPKYRHTFYPKLHMFDLIFKGYLVLDI